MYTILKDNMKMDKPSWSNYLGDSGQGRGIAAIGGSTNKGCMSRKGLNSKNDEDREFRMGSLITLGLGVNYFKNVSLDILAL